MWQEAQDGGKKFRKLESRAVIIIAFSGRKNGRYVEVSGGGGRLQP